MLQTLTKGIMKNSDEKNNGNDNNNNNNNNNHNAFKNGNSKNESCQKLVVDLDTIVEKYFQNFWETNKTKSQSKIELDDLDMKIDWGKVQFDYNEPVFEAAMENKMPQTQTLFRTFFSNKTEIEQEYSFKTERTTRQSCKFAFMEGFTNDKTGGITFKLPGEILEVGGGLRSEHTVEYGKDETKEQEIKWGCDSIIKVPPHTTTIAELVITEQEFNRNFTVDVFISGKISMTVTLKKDGSFIKQFRTNIYEIFMTALDNTWLAKCKSFFELSEQNGTKGVRATLKGKCKINLGISQNVTLQQQKLRLDKSSDSKLNQH